MMPVLRNAVRYTRSCFIVAALGACLPLVGCRPAAQSTPGGVAVAKPSAPRASAKPSQAPPAAPGATAEQLRRLEAQLRQQIRKAPAQLVAVYLYDVPSKRTLKINADRTFKAASLMKIPVAAAVLTKWEKQPSLRTPALEKAMWRMIAESNNRDTDTLIDHAGGLQAVNAFSRAQGWNATEVNFKLLQWRTRRKHNFTSPRDQMAMLRAIDDRKLVSPQASEALWGMLKDQTMRQRIPAGIPPHPGLEVGSKTGTLISVLHDVGIVRSPKAHYILCILTAAPRSEPAGDVFCREISRTVWNGIAGG